MDDNEKSRTLGSILNTLEELEHKVGRLPEYEMFIHQAFKSLKRTVEHTYNQLEYGKDYLFKNKLNLKSLAPHIRLINKAYEIEQQNPHLDFYEVNRLANEQVKKS